MDNKTIQFEIVTPERVVLKEEILQITVPTKMGEITVLPNHLPLVSSLLPGVVQVKKKNGEDEIISVSGGFLEVAKDKVIILADTAERAEEIDVARAEEARERARQLVSQARPDAESFAQASALLEKSLVRLRVANRARHRGHHVVGSEGILPE